MGIVNSMFSDEELLEFLNKAVSDDNERPSKMKKNVKVNKVDSISKEEKDAPLSKKGNPISDELRELKVQINEVTALKNEIADLKKQINQKGETYQGNRNRFRRYGCRVFHKEFHYGGGNLVANNKVYCSQKQ